MLNCATNFQEFCDYRYECKMHVLVVHKPCCQETAIKRVKVLVAETIVKLKMKGLKIILPCLVLLMVTVLNTESRQPVLHRVGGGKYTWKPNVNFTDWAIHEQFYVGDWLYFGFNKQLYNVLQVNKTSYENCIDGNFIKNITRGGRDVFNLTEAKPYYFLCGRGYCFQGMKVAINVQDSLASPLTNGSLPTASRNGSWPVAISSAPNSSGKLILPVMVASTLAWLL